MESHLEGAWLVEARLQGTRMMGVHLKGATMTGAYLHGADLREAVGITQEQLNTALGDHTTKLPSGLTYPDHWPKAPNEQDSGTES